MDPAKLTYYVYLGEAFKGTYDSHGLSSKKLINNVISFYRRCTGELIKVGKLSPLDYMYFAILLSMEARTPKIHITGIPRLELHHMAINYYLISFDDLLSLKELA